MILDTNILVSALIQRNYPYLIVDHCIIGEAIVCISEKVLQEYLEVLGREKFARFPEFRNNADFILARISEVAERFVPTKVVGSMKDEPDNRFLELADVSKADFLVTGNVNDFTMKTYGTTKIVTPKVYWEQCK